MPTIEEDLARIERDFTNHAPSDARIVDVFEGLRTKAKQFAADVVVSVPPSRERSLALTNIEQGLMYAIAGVARNQDAVVTMLDQA